MKARKKMAKKKKKDETMLNIQIALLSIFIICIGLIFSNLNLWNKLDKKEFNPSYGYENAVHFFKQQCEDNDMLFEYVTQGGYIRCFNYTSTVFYDMNYTKILELENDRNN